MLATIRQDLRKLAQLLRLSHPGACCGDLGLDPSMGCDADALQVICIRASNGSAKTLNARKMAQLARTRTMLVQVASRLAD